MRTQVTFDVRDPHAQAAFWAGVLDLEVEDHGALVDALVAEGRLPAGERITVSGRSAFRQVAACKDPAGVEPRLYFQQVPEAKVAKNRVHLDVHVEPGAKEREVARVVALGAELVASHSDRGPLTHVMRDPEGNEFCIH